MVGVPGKSKGCSTCRRRKKGVCVFDTHGRLGVVKVLIYPCRQCDQKRPVCGQCSASGYVCGGYQRDLTFVLHPASKAVEKAIFLPSKPRSSLLASGQSLERSAIVSQCQSLFFDVYLPRGKCLVSDQFSLKCGRPSNWTYLMQTFTPTEISLELAFAAFCVSRVGRNKDDPRLIKESTKFYGKALKTLQKALYDPSRMHSEQVLTACLLLGLYETFEGAGGKSVGWVSHAQGAARIVELRGPERHAAPPAHILFLGTRLPIIYSAILRRKKTFLSEKDWLTIPWRSEPKTGLDQLIDIVTHVPGLLEQFDAVRSQIPSTGQRQALQACLSLCRQLQKSLTDWTTIRRPNSGPIPVHHEPTSSNDTYPFPEELTYENYLFLNANLIHWSAALVISTTLSEIEFLLASFGFQSTSMLSSTASAIQDAQECANNIAKSIPYCLWPEMGDVGIDYIQFPMCLTFQFFMKSNNSSVCSWLLEKANEMQKPCSTSTSSSDNTPSPYSGGDMGLAMFGTSGFSTPSRQGRPFSALTAATDKIATPTDRAGSLPTNRIEQSYGATTVSRLNASSAVTGSMVDSNDLDFDADYDLDSDYEGQTSPSNDSGPPTGCSSRHGSIAGPNALLPPAGTALVDFGEYTFIAENPAKYYIDRSDSVLLDVS